MIFFTLNESKKCGFGFIEELHHVVCDTPFVRWWHRLEIVHIERRSTEDS